MSESRGSRGEVFLDARGNGRALRLTWHHEADVVVLSLWRDNACAGTFRLATADVNDFVDALVDGIRDETDLAPAGSAPGTPPPAQRRPVAPPDTGELSAPTPPAEPGFQDWAFDTAPSRAAAS